MTDLKDNISLEIEKKSLVDSDRIRNIDIQKDNIFIEIDSKDMNLDAKKETEEKLINGLSSITSKENINVLYTNKSTKETKPQANLNVGHGPSLPQKKKVNGVDNLILVSSAKGGVGKSTVASNIAVTLSKEGKKVGLIDADIYGPSLPMLFGCRGEKVTANEKNKIEPINKHGVSLISFGLFVPESDAVIWRGPMLGGVLNQFLFDVNWGDLDYLIIDLPPGTGDVQLSLTQLVEISGAVIVSTPQDVALLDSFKGIDMFNKLNIPVLGMIENMSYFVTDESDKKYYIFGESGVESKCLEKNVNFLGKIPIEIALRESCDNGNPYMSNQENEGKETWKSYKNICEKITVGNKKKKGLLSKIFK